MKVTFAPRGILQVDDARITFKNFKGEGGKFNREGDRNFAMIIPDEQLADDLIKEGWNVKIKPPREEGGVPFMYLSVKVRYNDYGPNVYLETGTKLTKLSEDVVGCLDGIHILSSDLDIRPYDWEVNDKVGRSAYLQSGKFVQECDRFVENNDGYSEPF